MKDANVTRSICDCENSVSQSHLSVYQLHKSYVVGYLLNVHTRCVHM